MSHKCHFSQDKAEITGECSIKDMVEVHKALESMIDNPQYTDAAIAIADVFGLEVDLGEQEGQDHEPC